MQQLYKVPIKQPIKGYQNLPTICLLIVSFPSVGNHLLPKDNNTNLSKFTAFQDILNVAKMAKLVYDREEYIVGKAENAQQCFLL